MKNPSPCQYRHRLKLRARDAYEKLEAEKPKKQRRVK